MARMTGKKGQIKIAAGTVLSMDSWDLSVKLDTVDATAFEDTWHVMLSTFLGWTGTCTGKYESGGANIDFWTAVLSGAVVVLHLIPDSAATEDFYGDAFCDFSIKETHNGVITFSAAFTGTGALTRTP